MASKEVNGGESFSSSNSCLSNTGTLPLNKSAINSDEGVNVVSSAEDIINGALEANEGRFKEREGLWKMVKKYIGMDIQSLDLCPISFLEPRTHLQRVAEMMEYSNLLDQADECEDPYMQQVYASSWPVAFSNAISRTYKPINPILGETCEMVNHDGITYIGEQVSHHLPIDAVHAENEHFVVDATNSFRTKLFTNSLEVYPVSRTRVAFKRDGAVLDVCPPHVKINNLLFGRTWISTCGDLRLTNLTTGDYTALKFRSFGWFSGARFEVDGYVYNAANEPKILMTGKWTKSMRYQPCDKEGKPLLGTEPKEVWRIADEPVVRDKYRLTCFANKVNSFDTAPRKMLPSDSRLRPDRRALQRGNLSQAKREKKQCFLDGTPSLEARQRNEKKRRDASGDKLTPKWFDLTEDVATTPWGETHIYRYNDKYDEHLATGNRLNRSSDEADTLPTEFNPWQYSTSI